MFIEPDLEDIPRPAEIIAAMDKTVAGLEKVKARLAWTLYRHQVSAVLGRPWRPSNILMHGPTGGGKTFIAKAAVEACKVIFTEAAITEFSDVGFAGRNLAAMYLGLFTDRWHGSSGLVLHGDDEPIGIKTDEGGERHPDADQIELAERFGVVILDEFDKIRALPDQILQERQAGKANMMQAELLKLSEGMEVVVKETDDDGGFRFKTDHVLHIAVGAFQGLAEQMAGRDGVPFATLHEKARVNDFVKYGFKPEIMGRFSSIVPLPALRAEHLSRILREQLIPEVQLELADIGVELDVDDGGYSALSQKAIQDPIGARALRPILDDILCRPWSDAQPGQTIVVDAEAVKANVGRVVSKVYA